MRRDERGLASLEFLAVVPLMLTVAFMVWQLGVAGYAAVSANEAARAAARAASLDQDADAAAQAALPDGLDASVSGGRAGNGYSYTVRVDVPLFTRLGLGSVSRTVDMPAAR